MKKIRCRRSRGVFRNSLVFFFLQHGILGFLFGTSRLVERL